MTRGHSPDDSAAQSQPSFGAGRIDETVPLGSVSESGAVKKLDAGQALGRYVVLEVLGKGAMGEVLRAYDPKLRRELAVKRIVPSRLSTEAEARLVREAQAMAQLGHPNVVAVYDVDVTAVGLLVAMEYVRGGDLKAWLSERPPWRDIVRVFVQAGRGLHAAHESGLVHRDFKPANVLVADDGRVRVADFGLVKVAEPDRSNIDGSALEASVNSMSAMSVEDVDAELTDINVVLGTPRYMAPEQHAGPADAASDQFSFCIALWEALVGQSPYPGNTLQELADGKNRGPPPWPRDVRVPRRLVAAIEKGLAPRPHDRHRSMEALVEELERAMSARRRGLGLGAAAVSVIASVSAVVVVQARDADKCTGAPDRLAQRYDDQRRQAARQAFLDTGVPSAEAAWAATVPRLDAFADEWVTHYTEACEATAVRGEQSAAVLDLRMACLDRARGELGAIVGVFAQADAKTVERAHRLLEGLPQLDRCADVSALQQDVAPPPAGPVAEAVAAAREDLARSRALYRTGRYEESLAVADDVSERTKDLDYPPIHAEAALGRGDVLDYLGRYEDSEAALRQALELGLRERAYDVAIKAGTSLVYVVGGYLGRPEEAQWPARMALDLAEGIDAGPVLQARARNAMGHAHRIMGRWDDSEAAYREGIRRLADAVGERDSRVATLISALGAVLTEAGYFDRAEPEVRRAYELRRALIGDLHPDTALSARSYGQVLYELGRVEEAKKLYDHSYRARLSAHGPDHFFTAQSRADVGMALTRMGRPEQGLAETVAALEAVQPSLPDDHPVLMEILQPQEYALLRLGRLDEALDVSLRTTRLVEKAYGADHPFLGEQLTRLARARLARAELQEAEEAGTRAVKILETTRGKDHVMTMRARVVLGGTHTAAGEWDEARRLLEIAWAYFESAPIGSDERAGVAFALARALSMDATPSDRARELAQLARDDFAAAGSGSSAERAEVERWLAAPAEGSTRAPAHH